MSENKHETNMKHEQTNMNKHENKHENRKHV